MNKPNPPPPVPENKDIIYTSSEMTIGDAIAYTLGILLHICLWVLLIKY